MISAMESAGLEVSEMKLGKSKRGEQLIKIKVKRGGENISLSLNVRKLVDSRKGKASTSINGSNTSEFISRGDDGFIKMAINPTLVTINLDKTLGRGTYATVYEGNYLGTRVAIKRFSKADQACLRAFEREVEILSIFRGHGSHPSLVHMFGHYSDESHSYMILEIAQYGNANDYIRKNKGKISLVTKLKWAL